MMWLHCLFFSRHLAKAASPAQCQLLLFGPLDLISVLVCFLPQPFFCRTVCSFLPLTVPCRLPSLPHLKHVSLVPVLLPQTLSLMPSWCLTQNGAWFVIPLPGLSYRTQECLGRVSQNLPMSGNWSRPCPRSKRGGLDCNAYSFLYIRWGDASSESDSSWLQLGEGPFSVSYQ